MAQPARALPLGKQRDAQKDQERKELMEALARTRVLIQQAYCGFNHVNDQDLIESYVFEINALQSRYNYLLRRVKELEELS